MHLIFKCGHKDPSNQWKDRLVVRSAFVCPRCAAQILVPTCRTIQKGTKVLVIQLVRR